MMEDPHRSIFQGAKKMPVMLRHYPLTNKKIQLAAPSSLLG
jgi:hypothetical protein